MMASEHLICSICSENYNNTNLVPKALPCLHTFCRQCLTLFLEQTQDGNELPCPMCREPFQRPENGVDGLRTNFMLQDMIDSEKVAIRTSPEVQDEVLLIKNSLEVKLAGTVEDAVRCVAQTTQRVISEAEAWQTEMLGEIEKVNELMKEKIEKEYKLAAEAVRQDGDIEKTKLFQNISSSFSENTDLQLLKAGSPLQRIQNLDQGLDMRVHIDVSSQNAMLLPRSFSKKFSVSQNGTVLLQMNINDKIFLYKYDDNHYHYENSFSLEQEMQGCRAFLTPNGSHIILTKIVSSGRFPYFFKRTETKTWIMTPKMEKESYHCGHFGDLMCVSDERLLYKLEDASGTLMFVYNFKHELMWSVVLSAEEKKTISRAVLNPVSHDVAAIVKSKGKKGQEAALVMFNSSGNNYKTMPTEYRKIEHSSEHLIVFSEKEELMFYNWKGKFARSLKYTSMKCSFSVASPPPDCVCQSQDERNRIMHILTRDTPFHRRCVVACSVC